MKFFFLIVTIFLLSAQSSYAEDYPTRGLLYNTKEASSMEYTCKLLPDRKLECDFNQTSVRKKKKIEEVSSELKKLEKEWPPKDEKEELAFCQSFPTLLDLFSGKIDIEKAWEKLPAEEFGDKNPEQKQKFIENFEKRSPADKKEFILSMEPLRAFCSNPTKEGFLEFMKSSLEKETKTCYVAGGNSFTQRFVYITDSQSKAGSWVVESSPSGDCGLVQLSRFIPETNKDYLGKDGSIQYWKYLAKKAVTNPDGKFLLSSCKNFDENEYLYDWKQETDFNSIYHLNCEYIEFSPI